MYHLALVTGATSGLGEALASLLYKRGISLFLTGRDPARLEAISRCYGAKSLPLDLRQSRAPLIDWIRVQAPDLVINNAGFGLYGPVLSHPTKRQMEILEVNGAAPIEIAIEAARALHFAKKRGTIINISSAAGEFSFPTFSLYAASKRLLTSFSRSFDAEMRPHGIRILASLPGQIATPFASRASQGSFSEKPSLTTMTPEAAARLIWRQIESGKGVRVIDFRTRISVALSRLFPRFLVEKILQKNLAKRYTSCP